MRKIAAAVLFALALWSQPALAQSGCSSIATGAVLTAAAWNACFQGKLDNLGYVPLNPANINSSLVLVGGILGVNLANPNIWTAQQTITSGSNVAFAVGLNGATNPAFVVDDSTILQATGLKVKGDVTGGTVAVTAIDSGSNTNLTINAKGTGTIGIGNVSIGAVTITPALIAAGAVQFTGLSGGAASKYLCLDAGNNVVSSNSAC
jgi:hypothetical protein